MDPATIIFAGGLSAALILGPALAILTYHRRKIVEMRLKGGSRAEDSAAYLELEERMRILERIVTDKGYDVAHQIEALRDRPRELGSQR
jgi:hypothetical protein